MGISREVDDKFGGIYDMMMGVGFMKMDAHQEKMIGWILFIVGYFPTWVLNKMRTSTITISLSLL